LTGSTGKGKGASGEEPGKEKILKNSLDFAKKYALSPLEKRKKKEKLGTSSKGPRSQKTA